MALSASAGPEAMQAAEVRATKLGQDLVEAIRTRHFYPEQVAKLASIREYFMRLVERNKDTWPHEAEVWSRLGWK